MFAPRDRPAMTTGYGKGRRPLLVVAGTAAYVALGGWLWRHQFVTEPVTGGVLRAFSVTELAAIASAPLVVAGLSARFPVAEMCSPRRLDRRAARVAAGMATGYALLPLLVLAAVHMAPHALPVGTYVDIHTEDRPLTEIYTSPFAVAVAGAVVATFAFTLLAAALVGPGFGVLLSLAFQGVVVMVQSTPGGSALALGGAGDPPYQVHWGGLALAGVALALSLIAWRASIAGAQPLIGPAWARISAVLAT